MRQLTVNDLEYLALGSAILGSGGGGDPAYDLLMARHEMEKYGPVTLLDLDDLNPDDLIVPVGFMGAPLVCIEKLPCGREFEELLRILEETLKRKPSAILSAEIGGANAFTPLTIAGRLNLPVVDADTLGRAFPQLQMSSCNLMGVPIAPAYLADSLGNTVMLNVSDANTLEKMARHVTVAMGSSCAVAMYLMDGTQAKQCVIPGSVSQAIAIGRCIHEARVRSVDPIKALLQEVGGVVLGTGSIVDINQSIKDGFLEGTATIMDKDGCIDLLYQNEYLLARQQEKVLATTPDILMLMEVENGTPITSESLRYGLRVALVALPAPKIWQTPEGLKLVGPRFFGYEVDYVPITQEILTQ